MRRTAAVCACLAAAVLLASAAQAAPTGRLWHAICTVESGGDPDAYNPKERAAGIAQIRPVCLKDVNRIARLRGVDERFTYADRNDPEAARRMWRLYLEHYGQDYRRRTGRPATAEVYARIWNGGPTGWRKRSTRGYWQRVQAVLEDVEP
jgi:hypothetical protein